MGKTYNENSSIQMAAVKSTTPHILAGVEHLNVSPPSVPMIIADFGSSHGQNSIEAMKNIIQHLKQANKLVESPLVVHNDLPTNDWTLLFQLLAKDNSYHGVANGRSFYEQCLPANSLSIGYSSTSLHWMSKIPCNLLNHCFHFYAEGKEHQLFQEQAKLDLNSFVEHRSRELLSGGILILSILIDPGIETNTFIHNPLYVCAQSLFNTKELLDYTPAMYYRSPAECIDLELFDRCSLQLIQTDIDQAETPSAAQYRSGQLTLDQHITSIRKILQNVIELPVRHMLEINGRSTQEIDQLLIKYWSLYEEKLREKVHAYPTAARLAWITLVLKKK